MRNVILHEIGHNLGLNHGGAVGCTGSPNYHSLMNYRYTYSGLPQACSIVPDGIPDFSVGAHITLDENHLNEYLGICGGTGHAIDWNVNGTYSTDVAVDLNREWDNTCSAPMSTLHDFSDWAAVNLPGVGLSLYPYGATHVERRPLRPDEICPSPPALP